jgi:two-component system sensor histidine kinase PilS (NtrC family)
VEPPGPDRLPGSQLPEPHRVLGWIYAARLLLLAALAVAAPWSGALFSSRGPSVALLIPLVAVFTAASLWLSHGPRRRASEGFLLVQLAFDALLVTTAVNLTGGQESLFAPLYVLLVCVSALLVPLPGGAMVSLLAVLLYLMSATTGPEGVTAPVLLQAGLFAVVAVVTGYLGAQLRASAAALGEARTELRRLRIDTGDILSTVSSGVLTVDGDGRLAFMNPAAEELLSLSAAAWTGRPILEKLDSIAPGLGTVVARSARERIPIRRFETDRLGDDSFILGVSTTIVERDEEGPGPAVTAVFQDITEKMKVEALRRRAERLEAVAELSASLAHEIKNPLASIRSAVEQIARGVSEEDALVLRTLVVRESDRLSRLLTEFIDFARVKVTAPEPVDLLPLLGNVVELVRAHPDAAGREVVLACEGAPASVWIRGAEDLMHRAIFNLALNGVQWAGEGGRVTLAIDEVRSDLLSPALGALGLIRVTVRDTGPGVPEDSVEQVFDPFFTRRPGGTGLGLALVQRAVEAHGGAIFVDNGPTGGERGATFSLYLPSLPCEVPAAPGAGEESSRGE